MKKQRIISVVLIALMIITGCFAAVNTIVQAENDESEGKSITVDLTGRHEGFSAVLYDNTNGLPTSEANAIVETKEGFIWIGSYSGLIRYDGNTFERMDSTTGIASVVSLFVDSKNRLWIGTNDSGVAVMDKGKVRMYNKDDGLKSLSVRSIAEDEAGNVYIATTHGIAYVDVDMNMHRIDSPQINEEYIRSIRLGRDGVIYGVTQDGAIFTITDGTIRAFYDAGKMGIGYVLSVLPDPEHKGFMYVGTGESKIYYGQLENGFADAKEIDVSPLNYVNDMEYYDGQLWVCADYGIGTYDGETFNFIDNLPMNNSIDHMITDYEGNIWFTSSRQGVMKIVSNRFSDVFDWYDLPDTVVNSTCMYGNTLFIGTDSGLIALDDSGIVDKIPVRSAKTAGGKSIDCADLLKLLKGCRIRSIIRDSKNRLWFSTYTKNVLVRFDGSNVVCFTQKDGMPSERVRTIYEEKDGTILAACTGGLVVIKDDKITELFDEKSGISNTEVLSVTAADNGDMIIGTDGDGIYVIRDSKATHIGMEDGLSSDVVMRVKKDMTRDIYWIVTSNSIAYMDGEYNVNTIKLFPYSNNFDMYENSKGEMWVLSSNGIYVTAVDELLANDAISTVFFSSDNGLPCVATANSYSELTKDGDLYIAGTTGVARVNIENDFTDVNEVKMAVPFIEADGEYIYPDEDGSFTIESTTKKLTIYPYVYNYSFMNPKVTFSLKGFDDSAYNVDRSDLKPVDYTNLKGGKYTFVMELRDSIGTDTKTLEVTINKKKALHELIWFNVIVGLLALTLLGLVVFFYVRYKMDALMKKEQEQKTFIKEIISAFAKIIDMKDKYTNGHSARVAVYTSMLAKELGYDDDTVEKYYNIAMLHDIGKIGIPPEVLNKPGKLTDEEFEIIKSHSALGYSALKDISIMEEIATGAGSHHERPDGKGYPNGLKGDEIPRVAQIIAVADTFDAMYSDRPYRARMNFDKAVSIIKENSGTQLQPDVVDAFLRLVEKGKFRDPNDTGGGTTEDINNIRKSFMK